MLGTMRKAHKENTRTPSHFQQSSRQCLLEVPPLPLVFQDEISRVKFINRQKNFVLIFSRILRYGTGGRSGLSFGQEQNLYGRLTPGLNRLDPAANDVTVFRVNRITREKKTLVFEEDGRSRTIFDMVGIPVPRKTNIRDILSTFGVWSRICWSQKNETNQDEIVDK